MVSYNMERIYTVNSVEEKWSVLKDVLEAAAHGIQKQETIS